MDISASFKGHGRKQKEKSSLLQKREPTNHDSYINRPMEIS